MSSYASFNAAVPVSGILDASGQMLAFEGRAFEKLLAFLKQAAALENLVGDDPELDAVVEGLKTAATQFGSPKQLRAEIQTDPNLSNPTPAHVWEALYRLCLGLSGSARRVVSYLEQLQKQTPSDPRRELLHTIAAGAAEDIGAADGPLALTAAFQGALEKTRPSLEGAADTLGKRLAKQQEQVGALDYQVRSLTEQIDDLGILRMGKRKALEAELKEKKAARNRASATAEQTRKTVAALEPLVSNAAWLPRALDGLVQFLNTYRPLFKTFNSRIVELKTRATDGELGDDTWLERALGLTKAVASWQAISKAATNFATGALTDW